MIGLLGLGQGDRRVAAMANDGRDLINLLEAELRFIELGGYDPSRPNAWYPKSIFRDSLTCINFGSPYRSRTCRDCHLFEFVESEHRSEDTPCHFIPLTDRGETIAGLERVTSVTRLKHEVKNWLRWKIQQLGTDRSRTNPAQLKGGLR